LFFEVAFSRNAKIQKKTIRNAIFKKNFHFFLLFFKIAKKSITEIKIIEIFLPHNQHFDIFS